MKEGVETEPRQSKHFLSYGKAGDPEKDAKRAAEYEARRAKRLEKDEKKIIRKYLVIFYGQLLAVYSGFENMIASSIWNAHTFSV